MSPTSTFKLWQLIEMFCVEYDSVVIRGIIGEASDPLPFNLQLLDFLAGMFQKYLWPAPCSKLPEFEHLTCRPTRG
jgi:hypothetical protein